ncbi:cutinase-domain-containing protein [Microdochium bolleyi]|uniref:Cutinase n=1 Tax=Microdochium bolleyi TaxID=196109 RepID=A0A136J6A4_9PEZI|nr:cutinase-domain-containing protein [Microdochium bolleyi]
MPSFTTSTLVLIGLTGSVLAGPIGVLEARQFGGGSSTRNELVNSNGACKSTIVIFARGTTEPGNVGVVVGPSLFSSLGGKVGGDLLVQGVDYTADWNGALSGGDQAGSQKMADLVTQAATQCPSSSIVISGYSQGAQLVHNAAGLLSSSVASKVSAAVVFGDPNNGRAIRGVSKVLSICYTDDNICSRGGGSGTGGHTAYGKDAAKAADFIVQNSGKRGGAAPAPVPAPTTTTAAPIESAVAFPSPSDAFPIAPVVPTGAPVLAPIESAIAFPSPSDAFPVAPGLPTGAPVLAPVESAIAFPSPSDAFPVAPAVPTGAPVIAPVDSAVAFPSSSDAFPTAPAAPTAAPTAAPVATPAPVPVPAPAPGTGAGSGNGRPSLQDLIDRLLAAWGKGRGKGN